MYRIVNTSSMLRVVNRLSAMILVAALSLFATSVGSAAGSSRSVGKSAKRSAQHKAKGPLGGVMFGGVTSTHAPVVIQVSRHAREVVEATMAVPCLFSLPVPGITISVPNYYLHLSISATGAFQGKTERTESEAGTTATVTGLISGQFNRAMTSVTGTWRLAIVDHGVTGAVAGQCDSGSVSFTAIQ
jgi:hypothetical protein